MLTNYLKTAYRTFVRQKGYSFINVAGLTLGLTCCLLIFQYVAFEYSFDRFHEHERDLYRVLQTTPIIGETFGGGGDDTAFPLGPALTEEVPEILHAARLHPEDDAVVSNPSRPERVFEEERAFYTDPAFLEMFTFPLVAGDAKTALEPGTILLSESAAQKYFGAENPMGQVLDVTDEIEKRYRVAGVFRDVPANSHLQFDLLLPIDDLIREEYADEPEGGWSRNNFNTYVQLQPGADRAAVGQKMTEVYKARRGEALREQGRTVHLSAQPLRDVHLNAEITARHTVVGSYRTVYFFTVIGLIILVIALVNYVNLATARAMGRAREVGVRKVVGAQREQLVVQFLCESALTNLAAAVLAVVLAVLLTPLVNDLAETHLTGERWMNPWFWAAFLVTLGIGTLLAGLYPAFVLSSFKPISVLKGKASPFAAQLWLRRGLVVLQFAASVVLLVGTAVVYNQLGYMRHMDLGIDLERVLTVNGPRVLPEGRNQEAAIATFVQELRRLPNVRHIATSESLPGQIFNRRGLPVRKAADNPASVIGGVATSIDTSFADLYGLELIAGKGFTDITVPDAEDAPGPVIASETAVRTLGFDTPTEAVGQALDLGGNEAYIAGVFKDFHWSSAHAARENAFFYLARGNPQVSIKMGTENLPRTLAAIEETYKRLFPDDPFRYAFADEQFDQQYRSDERFARLFGLFAGLAILIACLGLFGLAAFTAQRRTKEVGVRKVLGASVPGLVALLSADFLKLIAFAFVLAAPVAYFAMRRWLESFAYRIEIGPGVFVLTGALVLLIALMTVSYQAIKAATTDPVRSLRYE